MTLRGWSFKSEGKNECWSPTLVSECMHADGKEGEGFYVSVYNVHFYSIFAFIQSFILIPFPFCHFNTICCLWCLSLKHHQADDQVIHRQYCWDDCQNWNCFCMQCQVTIARSPAWVLLCHGEIPQASAQSSWWKVVTWQSEGVAASLCALLAQPLLLNMPLVLYQLFHILTITSWKEQCLNQSTRLLNHL